jgi:hypothetical protein
VCGSVLKEWQGCSCGARQGRHQHSACRTSKLVASAAVLDFRPVGREVTCSTLNELTAVAPNHLEGHTSRAMIKTVTTHCRSHTWRVPPSFAPLGSMAITWKGRPMRDSTEA